MSDLTTKAAEIRAGLEGVVERHAAATPATMDCRAWHDIGLLLALIEQQAMADGLTIERLSAELRKWDGDMRPHPVSILLERAAGALEARAAELAERDEQIRQLNAMCKAAELAEARADLAAQIAGHRHSAKEATTLLIERKARAKERDSIVAAGEALVAALSRYGFPMSEEAWRNTGDDAPANSQASVEARALHRAAEAFFREISGASHE